MKMLEIAFPRVIISKFSTLLTLSLTTKNEAPRSLKNCLLWQYYIYLKKKKNSLAVGTAGIDKKASEVQQ